MTHVIRSFCTDRLLAREKVHNHVCPTRKLNKMFPYINTADNAVYSEIPKELIDSVEGGRRCFGAQDGKKTDFYGANRQR